MRIRFGKDGLTVYLIRIYSFKPKILLIAKRMFKEEPQRPIPGYKVLLISKDQSTIQLMKRYLDLNQFKIYLVSNCSQAWKVLQNITPLVILLDKTLPEENRGNFLEKKELNAKLRNVPINIFTKKEYERKGADEPYKQDVVDFFKF